MSSAEWTYLVGRYHATSALSALIRFAGHYCHVVHSVDHLLIRIFIMPSMVKGLVALELFIVHCEVLKVSMSRLYRMVLPIDLINVIGVVFQLLLYPISSDMVWTVPFEMSISLVHLVVEYFSIDVLDRKSYMF